MDSDNEVDGNQQNETQKRGSDPKIIEKRNRRLANLFKLMDLPVRIMGDENMPSMIFDEKFIINAYVKNFDLIFTDNFDMGETVYTMKLNEVQQFDKSRILECIHNYPVKYVNKVMLKNTKPVLYLAGYNFLNKEDGLGRYPVFSSYAPKLYFREDKSKEVADELKNDGYDCVAIHEGKQNG